MIAKPEPRQPAFWRVVAGPESTLVFTQDRRPVVWMWTADRGGHMRVGDLVFLYGTKRLQSYVAVGRVCCDPRQNDRAQRLKKNRAWWVYLQAQPLTSPIPRQDVEVMPAVQPRGSGLHTPAGAATNRLSAEAAAAMADLLRAREPAAAKRFDDWCAGRGRYPPALDLEELRWAEWAPPEVSTPEELMLSRRVAARLVKTGRFRYLAAEDGVAPRRPAADDEAALSLEHPIRDLAGRGRVDILLVDRNSSHPATLLAIEVKIRASLAPARNPVPQIVRYREALKAALDGAWTIKTLVVAEHFTDDVLREADLKQIEHRLCKHQSGKLTVPL